MGGELPLFAIRSQIASAIDLIVHLGRLKDRKRRVLSVDEITGLDQGEIRCENILVYKKESGLGFSGRQPQNVEKWREIFSARPRFDENGAFRLEEDAPGSSDGGEAETDPPHAVAAGSV